MPYGYNGRILRVDLSRRKVDVETRTDLFYRKYLGGRGIISYFLLTEAPADADPLGPDNMLIFAPSVITGAQVVGVSRHSVGAISPVTGGYGESEAGGYWGPELKYAGFDAVIVTGRADGPVYLWIRDGRAEIRDARHLWGKTTGECQDMIAEELGDSQVRVAAIGPAGERLVKFACIVNDRTHVNGRTGIGAVMGSKNLKAIAVRGTRGKIEVKDADAVQEVARRCLVSYRQTHATLQELGTARGLMAQKAAGILPTRNFSEGDFEGASKISGETMKATILQGIDSCWHCPVRCKRVVAMEEPYRVDSRYGGPEYETLAAFGSNCGIDDLGAIAKANELCNALGLDTISAGMAVSFLFECCDRGLIDGRELGGLNPKFGDVATMLQLVEMIARREGIGDLLAEGTKRAAGRIGGEAVKAVLAVKGSELPMHEPRGKFTVGLSYAVAVMGADHLQAMHDPVYERRGPGLDQLKVLGLYEPLPSRSLSWQKVRAMAYLNLWASVVNTLDLCWLVATNAPVALLTIGDVVKVVNGVTGWDMSLWELMKAGERSLNMARAFAGRRGLSAADDALPDRFFEPLPSGPLAGAALDREEFAAALRGYYEMRGWNVETGMPERHKLEELGIADLVLAD